MDYSVLMIVFIQQERFIAEKQSAKSAHMKHLQYLSAEINKIKNCLSLIIIYDFFSVRKMQELSGGIHLANRNMHTKYFETCTISSLGPKLKKRNIRQNKRCLNGISFHIEN